MQTDRKRKPIDRKLPLADRPDAYLAARFRERAEDCSRIAKGLQRFPTYAREMELTGFAWESASLMAADYDVTAKIDPSDDPPETENENPENLLKTIQQNAIRKFGKSVIDLAGKLMDKDEFELYDLAVAEAFRKELKEFQGWYRMQNDPSADGA